ncbi:hypothetical protein ACFP3I_14030 [Chryseobacterium arachidis]|uniref:hypothetical protein n=1 Tax=Chryseobacterium arachidis TaxID=1416778 RepID=UPI00361AE226
MVERSLFKLSFTIKEILFISGFQMYVSENYFCSLAFNDRFTSKKIIPDFHHLHHYDENLSLF